MTCRAPWAALPCSSCSSAVAKARQPQKSTDSQKEDLACSPTGCCVSLPLQGSAPSLNQEQDARQHCKPLCTIALTKAQLEPLAYTTPGPVWQRSTPCCACRHPKGAPSTRFTSRTMMGRGGELPCMHPMLAGLAQCSCLRGGMHAERHVLACPTGRIHSRLLSRMAGLAGH